MNENISPGSDATGIASKPVLAMMRRIENREWWVWSSAMAVTILSAIGMVSFALPTPFGRPESLSAFFLDHAVRWLFVLVLVFNICVLYEQVQLHRIRYELADQLYELSVLDPLTGLFNRRYIEHRLQEEIARCQRLGSPITVILFDLDALKQINDEHGHAAGDNVLKALAERLKAATRGSDVAARYGGDEFLLLLADCKPDGVQYVLKRLSGLHIETNKEKLPISCSAGWADYIPGESLAAILKRADAALYVNKRKPPFVRMEH
ncbi:MAG TPA: GGDEF domain-containing protein [Candidatus Acidoferrales bacterium]|nr:GGDEF domain-containing protein [Candidatus Acidoferrales bacterium]